MQFKISEIATILGGELDGEGNQNINRIDKIDTARPGSITFLSNPTYENYIYSTQASAVIVKKDFNPKKPVTPALIKVDDPYLSFTLLLEEYDKIINFQKVGVEQPSFTGINFKAGEKLYLGAFVYVGNNVQLGDNVKIYPHSFIGDNVKIGNNCIVFAGVKIYANSIIGNECTIHAGAVIGSDGFGYAPQKDGSYKKIPQLGNVILEDSVDVGANTVIDCATLDSTYIRKGVKLDNLIQIAHNVEIGKDTVIAAQTGVSGSTKIGGNCVIAGQVGIAGHIKIADKVKIGAQTGIISSVEVPESVIIGSPALDKMRYFKSYALFRKLPELKQRIEQLEEKVLNLSAKLGHDEH
jgi:UDP-3-O-[3-hydroxymyristoyl] glucosamine N-acyltransferase